jgi:phosphoesterase RecJ-like protein
MKFSPVHIAQLKEILSLPKSVVIVTHRNPDGDALGSSLGFKFFLEKLGHEVSFISPNAFTLNLKWIKGTDSVMVYENAMGKKMCDARIKSADIIFCLDFNALSRLEGLGEVIKGAAAYKVMIDHHQQPESFADLAFSDTTYCATAEMIYDIIADMGQTDLLDEQIAECLYTSLTTPRPMPTW